MQVVKQNDALEISVVIPTRNRPHFVIQAVNSALRQTFTGTIEVIVVIDGEDAATNAALRAIFDPRLRVIALAASVGGSEARNAGVRAARGHWIAFLDDDDEWLPHKLSRQIAAAHGTSALYPVVSSRLFTRAPFGECIRPQRPFNPALPVSEYLFCRNLFTDTSCALQTSTLFVPRSLLLRVPFRAGLRRHQDWDWVLRAEREAGAQFIVLNEPLTAYRIEDGRSSVSRTQDWEFSFLWGRCMRDYFTPSAYAWFLASECASRAVKSGAPLFDRFRIAQRFFFHGRPSPRSTAMLAFFLLLPGFLRQFFLSDIRARRAREGHATTTTVPAQHPVGMEA